MGGRPPDNLRVNWSVGKRKCGFKKIVHDMPPSALRCAVLPSDFQPPPPLPKATLPCLNSRRRQTPSPCRRWCPVRRCRRRSRARAGVARARSVESARARRASPRLLQALRTHILERNRSVVVRGRVPQAARRHADTLLARRAEGSWRWGVDCRRGGMHPRCRGQRGADWPAAGSRRARQTPAACTAASTALQRQQTGSERGGAARGEGGARALTRSASVTARAAASGDHALPSSADSTSCSIMRCTAGAGNLRAGGKRAVVAAARENVLLGARERRKPHRLSSSGPSR